MKDLRRFGFKDKTQINAAGLGHGFKIYTIKPDRFLKDEKIPIDYVSSVTPTNQWQFLVVGGNNTYSVLTVDRVNGKWVTVSVGSSDLAKELSAVLKNWPESSGYQHKLIVIYQASSEFIEISHKGKLLGIIPLTSLLVAMSDKTGPTLLESNNCKFNPHDLRDPATVLQGLRSVVNENIRKFK